MTGDHVLTDTASKDEFTLKARWLFPVCSPPIAGGTVAVRRGKIVDVGPGNPVAKVVDLGNVALLPGLVNAHAHLEFSELDEPLGRPGMPFPDWIDEVINYRQRNQVGTRKPEILRRGADECARNGTTTLGEIATAPVPTDIYRQAKIRCTLFHEVIGLSHERAAASLDSATIWLDEMLRHDTGIQPGISPHAPYSVSQDLLLKSIKLSRDRCLPLAMHLAESPEELELLASHSGPFVELLARLGFWDPSAVARGQRPRDFLEQLANAHRALVIHGNYLVSDEISLLAANRGKMSVVYCPRTHAYFRHGDYPLVEMLNQGVSVALGNDSRASNPDLSLWKEMQFVAQRHPNVSPEEILRMGTLAGAAALGVDQHFGTLAVGKQADFCVIALPEHPGDVWELLFDAESAVSSLG